MLCTALQKAQQCCYLQGAVDFAPVLEQLLHDEVVHEVRLAKCGILLGLNITTELSRDSGKIMWSLADVVI